MKKTIVLIPLPSLIKKKSFVRSFSAQNWINLRKKLEMATGIRAAPRQANCEYQFWHRLGREFE